MGLIKAGMGAVGGVLGDQWKEFIYCESLKPDVLVAKGMKRVSSRGRSSNTSAEDNIISNGSTIAINDGQCMVIVENGKVVEDIELIENPKWKSGLQMEEKLHTELLRFATKETTFEELYYHMNEFIVENGFVNLDFMGNRFR